jgi:dTDP-4-dehydrorhamnose reductase
VKALIVGANGQLGRALAAVVPDGAETVAPPETECDLTRPEQLREWIGRVRPDVVFNAAAYTAVDAAEKDAETAELVNATSVARLAEIVAGSGARLVHVSTDFVFDGTSSRPYTPQDQPNPLSVYGRTKLDGERAALAADALVVRTAWVYAEAGRNFVLTMLRLMAERDEVKVVADQIGTPTYARDLAGALWALAGKGASGLYHFTDEGVASWYDFAVAIREEALAAGIFDHAGRVTPIAATAYPTPAKRPAFGVLDKSKTHAMIGVGRHWREALREMLIRYKNG